MDEVPAGAVDWSGRKELFYSLGHIRCLVICCGIVPCGAVFQVHDTAVNTFSAFLVCCCWFSLFFFGVRMILDCDMINDNDK